MDERGMNNRCADKGRNQNGRQSKGEIMMNLKTASFFRVNLFLSVCLAGCFDGTAQVEKASVVVDGARCEMCVDRIQSTLDNLEGMRSARMDLEEKTASVEFETAKVTLYEIRAAIAGAGYTADSVARDSMAYEALPSCCK
jgi:copper chaperone CopZ